MPDEGNRYEELLGGQMSFLGHLDEFRRRLVRSALIVGVAFCICWFFSAGNLQFSRYSCSRRVSRGTKKSGFPLTGITLGGKGNGTAVDECQRRRYRILCLRQANKYRNDSGRRRNIGPGACRKRSSGKSGTLLETTDLCVRLHIPKRRQTTLDLKVVEKSATADANERMVITTAVEPFTLYVTVSLYAAIALSVPFLLLQVWGFISPALYKHEKKIRNAVHFSLFNFIRTGCGLCILHSVSAGRELLTRNGF